MTKMESMKAMLLSKEAMIGTWREGGSIVLAMKLDGRLTTVTMEVGEAEKLVNQLAGHIMRLTGMPPAIETGEV